jgi:integrase
MPPNRPRKQRVPQLRYSDWRGIGYHANYRDLETNTPRKKVFGRVTKAEAERLYHQWLADRLNGRPEAEGTGRKRRQASSKAAADVVPGSLLHVASDLLRYDQERVRSEAGPKTPGTLHPRACANRKKALTDFLRYMNERHGQAAVAHMQLLDVAMQDVETFNRSLVKEGLSDAAVKARMQMIKALIDRAGRPEFGHQALAWNWDARDLIHGQTRVARQLPTYDQLKRLLRASEPREQALIWMGLGLGFGPSDLAAVRVGQIDHRRYDLRRGKTGIDRYGDTPPRVWKVIQAYLETSPKKKGDLLFVTRNGNPLVHGSTNAVTLWWTKLRQQIGETKDSLGGFYVLRHLGATEFGDRDGCSISAMKRWLGHAASSRVADTYMKPVAPEHRQIVVGVRRLLNSPR